MRSTLGRLCSASWHASLPMLLGVFHRLCAPVPPRGGSGGSGADVGGGVLCGDGAADGGLEPGYKLAEEALVANKPLVRQACAPCAGARGLSLPPPPVRAGPALGAASALAPAGAAVRPPGAASVVSVGVVGGEAPGVASTTALVSTAGFEVAPCARRGRCAQSDAFRPRAPWAACGAPRSWRSTLGGPDACLCRGLDIRSSRSRGRHRTVRARLQVKHGCGCARGAQHSSAHANADKNPRRSLSLRTAGRHDRAGCVPVRSRQRHRELLRSAAESSAQRERRCDGLWARQHTVVVGHLHKFG
jgi:hypothetical protein